MFMTSLDPFESGPESIGIVIWADYVRQSQAIAGYSASLLDIDFAFELVLLYKTKSYVSILVVLLLDFSQSEAFGLDVNVFLFDGEFDLFEGVIVD